MFHNTDKDKNIYKRTFDWSYGLLIPLVLILIANVSTIRWISKEN